MPPKPRGKEQAPASRVYSPSPSLQQIQFPPRRRSIRTYGKQKPRREGPLRQQTITQIDFLQPTHPEELDEIEGKPEVSGSAVGFEEEEEKRRKKKRRKTEGDEPDSEPTSSFHTQTLTQFYKGEGLKRETTRATINDSEDEDEDQNSDGGLDEFITTGRRVRINDVEEEIPNRRIETKSPSVIPQTPLKKQTRVEIPSSQPSPCTPMLLRYSPLGPRSSPLKSRSSNVISPTKPGRRTAKGTTPRTLVIQDSFASAVTVSSGPSQSSLRFGKGMQRTHHTIPSSQADKTMPEDNESASRSEEYSDENKCSVPSQEKRPERSRVVTIPDSDDEAEDLDDGDNLDNPAREQTPTRHSVSPPKLKAAKSGKRIEPGGEKQNEEDAYAVGEETQFALDLLASGTEGTLSTIQSGYQETSQNSSRKRPDPVKQTPRQTRKKATVTFSSPQFCPDEEDDHAAQHKTQVYTQMNSQRVDLAIIRAMPPPTDRSDIFISIHPQHVQKIVNGTKDHEFRTWKIPSTVSRIWIYVTKPESMLRYMACIGPAKVPGEIVNERGIGNAEFNKKAGKPGFAYEIEELYELNNPVPLKRMKDNGWVDAAPQKYAFVPPVVVSQLQANLRCQLLLDDDGEGPIFEDEINASQPKQSATLSQETGEVEAQLLSDIAYSTQHPTSDDRVLPASSQKTPRPRRRSARQTQKIPPVDQPASPSSGQKRKRGAERTIASSQATTASESSTPSRSQDLSVPRLPNSSPTQPIFHDSGSPVRIPEGDFDLRTSQLVTASQLLPETLMRDDESGPPMG